MVDENVESFSNNILDRLYITGRLILVYDFIVSVWALRLVKIWGVEGERDWTVLEAL